MRYHLIMLKDTTRIDALLLELELPEWVERIRTKLIFDHVGEQAVEVWLIVKPGNDAIFYQGDLLLDISVKVLRHLQAHDIEIWPYVNFIDAREAA
jgi:hypothetical protein